MSSDGDSEQENEAFSTEKDFEGGRWIDGEFFFKSQRKGRTQTENERIYGVFADDDSDDDSGGGGGGRGNRKKKRARVADTSKPMEFVAGKKKHFIDENDMANAPPTVAAPVEDPDEDDNSIRDNFKNMIGAVVEEAPSKSNDDFKKLLEQDELNGGALPSLKTVQPAAVNLKELGSWEKHTKGIGLKLLQKFGFTGRLGAREDGVSRAIEVVVRPGSQGLGFGDFTEQSSLKVNKKIEAEWRGKEFKEEEEEKEQSKTQKKSAIEKMADSKGWKKTKKVKIAPKVISVADFINRELDSEAKKQVIIDMRGQETKIVTDLADLNTVPGPEGLTRKPKLGEELLYNLNKVNDMVEIEAVEASRKLKQSTQRLESLMTELDLVDRQVASDKPRLDKLHQLQEVLNRVAERQKADREEAESQALALAGKEEEEEGDGSGQSVSSSSSSSGRKPISLGAICSLMRTLHEKFPDEFRLFGLMRMLPTLSSSLLNKLFTEWVPLKDPLRIVEVRASWSMLTEYFDSVGERTLCEQARIMMEQAIEQKVMPAVRRALTTDWDVKNPEGCVELVESMKLAFANASVGDQMIDMLVLPKLVATVRSWNPTTDPVPIHTWLHPWLPMMGSKLSVLYPDIRRKIGQALSSWNPLDKSALTILTPWKSVFDRSSMDNLIIRAIVPKLVIALRDLQINPQNQGLSLFHAVLAWQGTVPPVHFASIFLGEFFPKWVRVLVQWLSISPDFAEVSQWYIGWKSSFPEELLEEPDFIAPFNTALDLMNAALSDIDGEELARLAGASIHESSYIQVLEKKSQETRMRERLRELEAPAVPTGGRGGGGERGGASSLSGSAYTFKDVVEAFASRNGVEFMPRIGKTHEGKQVWRFGSKSCYLEHDVVFVHTPEVQSWRPMGLEDLLNLVLKS